MKAITEAQKERLLEKVRIYQLAELSDKDCEVLAGLLHSEPLLKAMGRVYAYAQTLPYRIAESNFSDPAQIHRAVQTQGIMRGYIDCLEAFFTLVTLPEEKEDDSTEPAE